MTWRSFILTVRLTFNYLIMSHYLGIDFSRNINGLVLSETDVHLQVEKLRGVLGEDSLRQQAIAPFSVFGHPNYHLKFFLICCFLRLHPV